MKEWKEYKLRELAFMKNGKKRPIGNGTFPVYGGNGIMDYTDNFNSERTIIVGRVGAYCGCVYKCDDKCWVSDNAIAVYTRDLVDFYFLYYLMTTLDFHHHHIGGAQPLMTQDIIGDVNVKVPSIQTQKEVVSILKSLDDKIDCNRRINDNLEQQAQALFKSWFVDFEPFKGGEFVESEMGMIPKNWSVKQLGDVTVQQNEKVKDRTDVKVLSPVTTGELVLSEEYFTKQVYSESVSKYIVVRPKDFAYNPARVNIGSLGMNEFEFDGCVSPVYVVFRCENEYQYYFDLFRHTEFFKEEVKTRAIGGVRQSLGYKDFSLIKVVYPPIDVIHKFNQVYSKILANIKSNKTEIARLASLRDTLLPKLMSGELKVNVLNA